MRLMSGEIVEVYAEQGIAMGKVRVGGAFLRVPLMFVEGAAAGDRVLIESGVAIARITSESPMEERHVPRNPG